MDVTTTEEALGEVRRDFDDLLSQQAMGFTVDLCGYLRARRLAKTKKLTAILVQPVLLIIDPVLSLHFDIFVMSSGDVIGAGPVQRVDVHVKRHFRKSRWHAGAKLRSAA